MPCLFITFEAEVIISPFVCIKKTITTSNKGQVVKNVKHFTAHKTTTKLHKSYCKKVCFLDQARMAQIHQQLNRNLLK